MVEISDLPNELQAYEPAASLSPVSSVLPPRSLHEVEREAIATMLSHCGFNVTLAARRLGISKPTLYSKVREHGINLERGQRVE